MGACVRSRGGERWNRLNLLHRKKFDETLEKMAQLTAQWREQQVEARRLDEAIADTFARLCFGNVTTSNTRLDNKEKNAES